MNRERRVAALSTANDEGTIQENFIEGEWGEMYVKREFCLFPSCGNACGWPNILIYQMEINN